jgi:hypothetical protein
MLRMPGHSERFAIDIGSELVDQQSIDAGGSKRSGC